MDSNKLSELLEKINYNFDRVLTELDELRKENLHLKDQLKSREAELSNFTNTDNFANIVRGIDPEGEDAERLKARIDENIQELDKCIALLSDK